MLSAYLYADRGLVLCSVRCKSDHADASKARNRECVLDCSLLIARSERLNEDRKELGGGEATRPVLHAFAYRLRDSWDKSLQQGLVKRWTSQLPSLPHRTHTDFKKATEPADLSG